jgi:hypothetical protein
MKTNANHRGLKVNTGVKAGALHPNHSRGLKVASGIKAGALTSNHSRGLKVRTGLKAAGTIVLPNHNRRVLWG